MARDVWLPRCRPAHPRVAVRLRAGLVVASAARRRKQIGMNLLSMPPRGPPAHLPLAHLPHSCAPSCSILLLSGYLFTFHKPPLEPACLCIHLIRCKPASQFWTINIIRCKPSTIWALHAPPSRVALGLKTMPTLPSLPFSPWAALDPSSTLFPHQHLNPETKTTKSPPPLRVSTLRPKPQHTQNQQPKGIHPPT
jgi:hypothetical protein